MPTASFCGRCHHDNVAGTLFCGYCGARLTPTTAGDDPLVGTTIKAMYHVQEKIGAGGMGDVYKAVHISLERPVAIKILRRGLGEPALVQQFLHEARAASKLRHPNVIAVNDFGQTETVNIQPLAASSASLCGKSLRATLPPKSVVMFVLTPQ